MLPLIPGLVLLVITLIGGEGNDNAVVRWAQECGWIALVIGGAGFLVLSVLAAWVLRCRHCGNRLSRAGIKPADLINDFAGVRHCPHCGNGLTENDPTRRT
ncbi:MAG: hypothetical protein KDI75_02585 [Xanthomonadales bacterium]|nr:hypothetical protein [Xanthomonadales bacterium]